MEEDAESARRSDQDAEPSSGHVALASSDYNQKATKSSHFAHVGPKSKDQHVGPTSSRDTHVAPGPSCSNCLVPALLMALLLMCVALQSALIFLRVSGTGENRSVTSNCSYLQRSLWKNDMGTLLGFPDQSNQANIGRSRGCPDLWITLGDKCYFLSEDQQSYADSDKDCTERGSRLALVKRETIRRLVTITGKEFWVGLTQHNVHGRVWEGRWADGTMENVTGGIGSCAKLGSHLTWDNCFIALHWICERDAV